MEIIIHKRPINYNIEQVNNLQMPSYQTPQKLFNIYDIFTNNLPSPEDLETHGPGQKFGNPIQMDLNEMGQYFLKEKPLVTYCSLQPFQFNELPIEESPIGGVDLGIFQFVAGSPLKAYNGQWKFGKKHGKGRLYFADGTGFEGFFYEDDFKYLFLFVTIDLEDIILKLDRTIKDPLLIIISWEMGKGKMCWVSEGDCYEGDWVDNQMHGDEKTGAGEILLRDGNIFKGMFFGSTAYGTKYTSLGQEIGKTVWVNPKDKRKIEEYQMERPPYLFFDAFGQCCGCRNFCYLFITAGLIAGLILLLSGNIKVLIPAIFLLLVFSICYLIFVLCNKTFKFVKNSTNSDKLYDHVWKVKTEGKPHLWWEMECYHYKHVRNKKGGSHKKKIVTWRGSETFHIQSFTDESGMIINLEDFAMTKVTFHQTYVFHDAHSRSKYNSQKSHFLDSNKHRDTYHSFYEHYTIDFYENYKLCVNREGSFTSCIRSLPCYLCGIFTFTYNCYDFLLEFITARKEFTYIKCLKA